MSKGRKSTPKPVRKKAPAKPAKRPITERKKRHPSGGPQKVPPGEGGHPKGH